MADKTEEKLEKEITKGKARLGMSIWDEEFSLPFPEETFGLCSTCHTLKAARTQYGRTRAKCYEFDVNLYGIDPVIECTAYIRRGEMTLNHMKEIATLIDLKRPMGFENE